MNTNNVTTYKINTTTTPITTTYTSAINTVPLSDFTIKCTGNLLNPNYYQYKIVSDDFKEIIEYVPDKVYEFIFKDGIKIKTVCAEEDEFDLDFAFYLALAKKKYGKTYNIDGVLCKAQELSYMKEYNKKVKQGKKLFFEAQKAKEKEELEKAKQKKQHKRIIEKKIAKKKRRKERENQNLINCIKQAIEETK